MNLANEENIILNKSFKNKQDLFRFISKKAYELKLVTSETKLYKGLLKREKETSTGMTEGFAIPHAKIPEISKPSLMILKLNEGIKWKTFDGSKVIIAICLLIPENKTNKIHIKLLSALAKKLLDKSFKENLKKAKNKQEIIKLINQISI